MVYWCPLISSVFGFICFCKFFISIILPVLIVVSMHFSYLLRAICFMRFEPWVGFVHELRLIVMGCWRLYSWHDNVYMILSPNASLILREYSVLNQDNRDKGQSAKDCHSSARDSPDYTQNLVTIIFKLCDQLVDLASLSLLCALPWSTYLNRCQCCLQLGLTCVRFSTSCTVHSDISFSNSLSLGSWSRQAYIIIAV